MAETKNATHLFELPGRQYHNSESWWTSFFAMLTLYRSQQDPQWSLSTFVFKGGWPTEQGRFTPGRLSVEQLIVEAGLSKNPFRLASWPNEFLQLKPDVCVLRQDEREVIFVEVKTIGASIARNHLRYLGMRNHLQEVGWSAKLYYLLSHGHECHGDFPLIEHSQVQVILWEDVLLSAIGTPVGQMLGVRLDEYATRPAVAPQYEAGPDR